MQTFKVTVFNEFIRCSKMNISIDLNSVFLKVYLNKIELEFYQFISNEH